MCFDTVMVCRPGELEQEASFITQRLVVFRSAAGDSAQRLPRSLTCEARIRSANACCCASSGLIFWRSMVSRPLRNSGIDRGRAFCGVYDVPSYHLAGHRAAAHDASCVDFISQVALRYYYYLQAMLEVRRYSRSRRPLASQLRHRILCVVATLMSLLASP